MIARALLLTCCFFLPLNLPAQDDDVFARQGDQVLTQRELDAAFLRIPEHIRYTFIRDGEKVDQLVQSLLRYKQIVADARDKGFEDDEMAALRLKLDMEQRFAEIWLENVVKEAPEADYEALALERYLANPEQFQSQERVDVTHILIEAGDKRSDEEALELATRLRAELLAEPEQFDAYVAQYSNDPGKVMNEGHYRDVRRGQMVAPFEEQAFAMREPGEISEPVKTTFGYHIIRLNNRFPAGTLPFEQVKGPLMEEAKKQYLTDYRRNYILGLSADPISIPEGAVEVMAKRHFGENLELAPGYYEQ